MTNNKKTFLLSFLILAAVNVFVFYPSFFTAAKADHIVYMTETAEMESLPELISYSFSYPRTRVLLSGDKILFRPIFYTVLSIEKWLWGYNVIHWQLTGLILHLIILALFMTLLKTIKPDPMATLFVLFFSMQYISCSLVTWHHMHGYLLFLILLLSALINFTLYIQSRHEDVKKLLIMAAFLFLACFTNEFGSVASLIIMLALLGHKKFILNSSLRGSNRSKNDAAILNNPYILLISPVIFTYVNCLDYMLRFPGRGIAQNLAHMNFFAALVKCFYQFIALVLTSFILPFSPGMFAIFPGEKNYAVLFSMIEMKLLGSLNQAVYINNLVLFVLLFAVFGILIWVRIKRKTISTDMPDMERKKEARNSLTVMVLSFGLLLSYIFVLVFFRTSGSSLKYISRNLYHFYIMTLIAAVIVFCLFVRACNVMGNWRTVFRRLVIIILCLGLLLNGLKVYQLNRQEREAFSPWGNYIMKLESFVKAHKDEADFSFQSISRNDGYATIIRMGDIPENKELKGYISDFFFRKYIDVYDPKYYVVYTRKEGISAFTSKEKAEQYLNKRKKDKGKR